MKYYIYTFKLAVFLILSVSFVACSSNDEKSELIKQWHNQGTKQNIEIIYPLNGIIFPPDIIAPTILWNDSSDANQWLAVVELNNKEIYKSDFLKNKSWQSDSSSWEDIKKQSINQKVKITILGLIRKKTQTDEKTKLISSNSVLISISKDSVKAPVFYRTVTLPFGFAIDHLNTISWRLGNVASYHSPKIVLENLPVCGNCHSFSVDGKTMGMDVDYGNDKGSYFISPIKKQIIMDFDNIITWSDYKKGEGEKTFGLLSQVSPDGRYVLSTVKDRSIFVKKPDLYYSQLFFPIKGIIAVYDTKTKKFWALPGADDKKFCQSNPSWSPDGKEIIFAKAPYFKLPEAENSKAVILPTRVAKDFISGKQDYKFDLYKIPFNNGKGGKALPIKGASNNGKSNYFAKYSPDGKWIVFTQANNFMLLQPDAKLYIMPAHGGTPRKMICNNPKTMNSWHSWSPNSKWLVFSSKARGPYTQLYLTHIDEEGNDSPPVFLEKLSVKNFAVNIPEFVNIKPRGIKKIIENFLDNDNYSFIRGKNKLDLGDLDGALKDINKSIKLEPNNDVSYNLRALIWVEKGEYQKAIEDFSKVIAITPKRFDAWANRATAKFNLQDFKGAIDDYTEVIKLNPKGSRAYYSRGSAKYNISDFKGAIDDYTKCINFNPKRKDAWFERGIAELQLNLQEKACKDLTKADELGNKKAKDYLLEYCK